MENRYQLEEGQIVLCTVGNIVGTTVFVKIEGDGEGTLTTSEISPGRIRNLRDYVVPGKKIVCKILKIQGDKTFLSLRRVKQNEKKELLEKISKEKSYKAILKTILKEDSESVINKVTESTTIFDLFKDGEDNSLLFEEYLTKDQTKKLLAILETKKEKAKEIKKTFKLSSNEGSGITKIKKILKNSCKDSNCIVNYVAAGKYRISIKGEDFKEIKSGINDSLINIEKLSKKENCVFEIEKN